MVDAILYRNFPFVVDGWMDGFKLFRIPKIRPKERKNERNLLVMEKQKSCKQNLGNYFERLDSVIISSVRIRCTQLDYIAYWHAGFMFIPFDYYSWCNHKRIRNVCSLRCFGMFAIKIGSRSHPKCSHSFRRISQFMTKFMRSCRLSAQFYY